MMKPTTTKLALGALLASSACAKINGIAVPAELNTYDGVIHVIVQTDPAARHEYDVAMSFTYTAANETLETGTILESLYLGPRK